MKNLVHFLLLSLHFNSIVQVSKKMVNMHKTILTIKSVFYFSVHMLKYFFLQSVGRNAIWSLCKCLLLLKSDFKKIWNVDTFL
jgi:hypothetical protein